MKVTAFFDGGNHRRKKAAAGGAVVYDEHGIELIAGANFIGEKTNNEAEYAGLLLALELAETVGADEVVIYGDSEVIVRQVDGRYKTRKDHLKILRDQVWEAGKRFKRVTIRETLPGKTGRRRDNNARADELCTESMKLRAHIRYDEEEVMNMDETQEGQEPAGETPSGEQQAEKMEETSTEQRGFAETESDQPADGEAQPEPAEGEQPASDGDAEPDTPAEGGDGEGAAEEAPAEGESPAAE